ncbi:cytosine deaminase [Phormidesmis priestleyi ULC007]|uniref:Cytosine deaminase n=1 Tax=Phormidesmis priestleyi ULC007 TaxID=1920490 RepID=A0A2T1DEA9_9CYAN|nr:cytosine deaminase [Phormidesmis priestleyi]PSB18819.1 cytosine deaminase [Phormidesmis priestleyi ULC007]PZO51042.1 MAG: cytosine deaminase [Phormidesmis priestleyi]
MLFDSNHYWLINAHIPPSLIVSGAKWTSKNADDPLLAVDLEIIDGMIATIVASGTYDTYRDPSIDLKGGMVWSCFVDMHTHLDKGHIWNRAPNPDGTFNSALTAVQTDAAKHWDETDVYRRMEFGLKCSYAHGTKAIRTHIDAFGEQGEIGFQVFKELRDRWANKLILQAVSLVTLDYFLTPEGERLADLVADVGGVLGGVVYTNPDIDAQLDRVFALAKERKLNLDFHTDENDDPTSMTLRHVAQAAIRQKYKGRIVCGHCCSLSVQEETEANKTIRLVKKAGIGVVSLPMCNLYLQGRKSGATPRWRGVTLLHELKRQRVSVAIASDNCRDPFFAFGDHDAMEVFNLSVRIAHLDHPYSDWANAITLTPADLMGLPQVGRIGVGLPADLVLFKARSYSELLSRSQHDRIVLRDGQSIDTTLPDYAELDDLFCSS